MKKNGQALTMEALIAAIILISAISFIYISMPKDQVLNNQESEKQLKEYAKNLLFTSSYPILEQGEITYELMREYSPRESDTASDEPGDKWNFDYKNSEKINTTYYSETDYNWTNHYLTIDHDDEIWPDNYTENLTINYLVRHHPTNEFVYPKNNGTLYQMLPFAEDGKPDVRSFNSSSIMVNEEGKGNYSVSMIWYETKEGETSNPSIVWTDKTISEHDEIVAFIKNESEGNINKKTKSARLIQSQHVMVYKNKSSGKLQVYGPNGTKVTTGESEKGVTIEDPDPKSKKKVIFKEPAKGAYSIHQGSGDGAGQRSDPIFVMVGEPKLVGEFSYLKALAFGEISLEEYDQLLDSSLPENVGYNFEVTDSDGDVFVNGEGEVLKIYNGPSPSESVSVDRVVFVQEQEGGFEVCTARLVLWYH